MHGSKKYFLVWNEKQLINNRRNLLFMQISPLECFCSLCLLSPKSQWMWQDRCLLQLGSTHRSTACMCAKVASAYFIGSVISVLHLSSFVIMKSFLRPRNSGFAGCVSVVVCYFASWNLFIFKWCQMRSVNMVSTMWTFLPISSWLLNVKWFKPIMKSGSCCHTVTTHSSSTAC